MVLSISKPWADLGKYIKDRLKEAIYEAELAEEFLKNSLLRNAAGKAFQAVKALVAAIAASNRDKIIATYRGTRRLSPTKVVERGDWIIATMPTSRMREVAALVGDRELRLAVELALDLHEFQYNVLDVDAEISRYPTEELVRRDVEEVVDYVRRVAKSKLEGED